MSDSEGIGTLKLQCPQGHPTGRILRDVPHQMIQYDPGATGARRFWPEEEDQPQFRARCNQCDRAVGESTATLQNAINALLADGSQRYASATLSYL
jgi:hypothetical protein